MDREQQYLLRGVERNGSAYIYLYLLENTLRNFLYNMLKDEFEPHHRDNWLTQALNRTPLQNYITAIENRRVEHLKKSGYLAIADEHPFAFLDLSELKEIILAHWNVFSDPFQDQTQLLATFDVIRVARNAIAHNRSISTELLTDLRHRSRQLLGCMNTRSPLPEEATSPVDADIIEEMFADRFLDVLRVFRNRSDLDSVLSPKLLFDHAQSIDAIGLSLNAITINYGTDSLTELLRHQHCRIRLLFLDPFSRATRDREREEGLTSGYLKSLTWNNITLLNTMCAGNSTGDWITNLKYKVYSHTVRINLFIINKNFAVVQYYGPRGRGLEMPCFVIKRRSTQPGLMDYYLRLFETEWDTARPAPSRAPSVLQRFVRHE